MTQLDLAAHLPPPWATPPLVAASHQVAGRVWEDSVLPPERVFRALTYFPPADTRVVVLGQDPYPTPGKANGLAFGLNPTWVAETGYQPHSSFRAVLAEVERSTGQRVQDWSLASWAAQGVLLLNTRLTVAAHRPMSHARLGWEAVVAEILAQVPADVWWFAWGAEARAVARRHAKRPELVLAASHPCRYSATRGRRPFVGCGHFALPGGIQWGV